MGAPLQSLVYYACIARDAAIVAECCTDAGSELPSLVSKWLPKIPPFHRRFSQTSKRRTLLCLIEDRFIYCAAVDEALGKSKAYLFLEEVRDDFKKLLKVRDLHSDLEALEPHCLDNDFDPVFRQLASEFTGFPLKDPVEEGSALPQEIPLNLEFPFPLPSTTLDNGNEAYSRQSKKKRGGSFLFCLGRNKQDKKGQDQGNGMEEQMLESNGGKVLDKGQTVEVVVEGSSQSFPDSQSRNLDCRTQRHAQRIWWRSVRLVLFFDAVVCTVLFGIWLGVCRGISCIKS